MFEYCVNIELNIELATAGPLSLSELRDRQEACLPGQHEGEPVCQVSWAKRAK
jgi:hypothetical protein